jgi:hypothetical protein
MVNAWLPRCFLGLPLLDGSTLEDPTTVVVVHEVSEVPLNHQKSGTVVEVNMTGTAPDVFLVDNRNLAVFERGGRFTYYGGSLRALACSTASSISRRVDCCRCTAPWRDCTGSGYGPPKP